MNNKVFRTNIDEGMRTMAMRLAKAVLLLIVVCFSSALAAYETQLVDGILWEYEVSSGVAIVGRGYGNQIYPAIPIETEGEIRIPSKLGNCPVVGIHSNAFYGCSKLTSVVIPEGVSTIGCAAFMNCAKLKSVTIPSTLNSIVDWAFENCDALERVNISDLASWCRISFARPNSNPLSSAHELYLNGDRVEHLVIPKGVTDVGEYAFYNCLSINAVTMHKDLASIGTYTFRYCTNLKYAKISSCVTTIQRAFPDAYAQFENIVICNGVKTIANQAFGGVKALTAVAIPKSVTYIGDSAFSGCANLEQLAINPGVLSIGSWPFWMCSKLSRIYIAEEDPERVKGLITKTGTSTTGLTFCTLIGDVVLPASVTGGKDLKVERWWCLENLPVHDVSDESLCTVLTGDFGKRNADGKVMCPWQDYVAGTDPTDPTDHFIATIAVENGVPVVSWQPKLEVDEEAIRQYVISGKRDLADTQWSVVDGNESDFRFFKVEVGMKD